MPTTLDDSINKQRIPGYDEIKISENGMPLPVTVELAGMGVIDSEPTSSFDRIPPFLIPLVAKHDHMFYDQLFLLPYLVFHFLDTTSNSWNAGEAVLWVDIATIIDKISMTNVY
jgi:hypothetical protein